MSQLELTAFAHNARLVGRGLVTPRERNSLLTGLSYPAVPGFKEKGGTSEAAARAIAGRCQTLRNRCLAALRKRDMTVEELAGVLGEPVVRVTPRVGDLVARGKVFRSGKRRKNSNGLRVVVWAADLRRGHLTAPVGDALASKCLEALRKKEMTVGELAVALGETDTRVRTRVWCLFEDARVFKSRKRRKGVGGHSAVIWTRNPETAADPDADRVELLEMRCLAALRERDMTSEELADAMGESVLNVRPRVSELFAQGKVFKTEMRRKNVSGHDGVVWALCSAANIGGAGGGSATGDTGQPDTHTPIIEDPPSSDYGAARADEVQKP